MSLYSSLKFSINIALSCSLISTFVYLMWFSVWLPSYMFAVATFYAGRGQHLMKNYTVYCTTARHWSFHTCLALQIYSILLNHTHLEDTDIILVSYV